jgi:sporulation protein YlmC with PRC-barrel domain
MGKRDFDTNGFEALLILPKYIPKNKIIGKHVFDYDLKRVGQAVDWTYTQEGEVSLIVSGLSNEDFLTTNKNIFVPFRYIERAKKIIILSKSIKKILEDKKRREVYKQKKQKESSKYFDEINKEIFKSLIKT